MSITLDVEEYCKNCPEFEPDVHRQVFYSLDYQMMNTIVRCKHRIKCDGLVEFLEKQKEKSNE